MNKSILFISGNIGKINEFSKILNPFNVISSENIDLPEIQTTSVEEVVEEKLNVGKSFTTSPFFIEDTGLFITSSPMNGFPGALIKFYYQHLKSSGICLMNGGNKAYIETIIGYWDGQDKHIFKGCIEGTIASAPIGNKGFGWDDVFIPSNDNPEKLTLAQMEPEQKEKVSMRAIAGLKFKEYLCKS
jgi:XTP/dITP diphosphohydrolase